MEKQKLQPGPKPRIKRTALPPPGDFIALGKSSAAKPRQSESDISKPIQPISRKPNLGSVAHTSVGQKRKDLSPVNPGAAKQARTFSPSFIRSKEKSFDTSQILPSVKLVDAQAHELEELVLAAHKKEEQDQIDGLICGAIKTLKLNRLKPDPMIYLTFMNLAKTQPAIFASTKITEHLLQFLRRDNTLTAVKPKPNTLLSIMTCNILLHVFQNEEIWPQSFMKVYVEDALGDRAWVDNENNKDFVANITKVFGTILPKKNTGHISSLKVGHETSVIQQVDSSSASGSKVKGEEEKIMEDLGISLEAEETILIRNRYAAQKDEMSIQSYVQEVVKDQLNKRQMIDSVSRNTLRFLTSVCGYLEVRLLASQKIETWLQNPKLNRPTQELLMSVVLNCNTHSEYDIEVISNLVKMRLKAKPVSNHYINCMRELINQHPDNLGTTMKRVIYNELSQQRNPNNMSVLAAMFTSHSEQSAKHLSAVFQELLCNREDYLRAIRALFREIVRSLKYEINLVEFCRGLMQDRREAAFQELEQVFKDRMLASIIDLITLACFLSVSPTIKELASAKAKDEKRDYTIWHTFQTQISTIQRDAIWFFHTKVKYIYNYSEKDFVTGLNRILFLESTESYSQKDNWPSESERNNLLPLVTEVPLMEDSLLRLHLLGLSPDLPVNCADALDIVEKLVLRSAVLFSGLPGLYVEQTDVLKMLLTLAEYTHPKEIGLPVRYDPPLLAIKPLYWKSWLILLILAATNPSTVGITVWDQYPTARCMMEMLITGCYEFPPFGLNGMSVDEIRGNELQIARAEKDNILVFEGHLAAATNGAVITENTSLLIGQLISLDPTGPARQPPANVMEQLKTLNEKYKLGKLLCQCRKPDFLLSIIESQGSSKSMPWLAELVQSSESSLSTLPLQCLCEFLLMKHQSSSMSESHSHHHKHKSIKSKVAGRLQDLLIGTEATHESASNLVQYFINRWSSKELKDREASVHAFKTIILHHKKQKTHVNGSDSEMDVDKPKVKLATDPYAWLHEKILTYPFIEDVMLQILTAMAKALVTEMNASRIQAYLVFTSNHCVYKNSALVTLLFTNLCDLITKRKTVLDALFTGHSDNVTKVYQCVVQMLVEYITFKLSNSSNETGDDSVRWTSGENKDKSANLPRDFIMSCLVMLTYGNVLSDVDENYEYLRHFWLPSSSYVINNKNLVIDDKLKLMMLQSGIELLVIEAMRDLKVVELLKFVKVAGLPVYVKSSLLEKLDEFAVEEPKVIINSTPDKGCTAGSTLMNILRSSVGEMDVDSKPAFTNIIKFGRSMTTIKESKRPEVKFPLDQIENILGNFFKGDGDKKVFQKLKQQLSKENIKKMESQDTAKYVIENLLRLFKQDESFAKAFCSSKETCVLIRILSMSNEKHSGSFGQLLNAIHGSKVLNRELENTLKHVDKAHSISGKREIASHGENTQELINELLKMKTLDNSLFAVFLERLENTDYETLDKEKLIRLGVDIIQGMGKVQMERFLNKFCQASNTQRSNRICVDVLVGIMKEMDDCYGIIIDWLCLLDPEILQLNPVLLRQFLFTSSQVDSKVCQKEENSSASYLASILTHETRNSTLQDCVHWMLGSTILIERFNASGCLDFLNMMINNPRLFQGRDNKHHQRDSSFDGNTSPLMLSLQQTYQLVQIILMELSSFLSKNDEEKNTFKDITTLMERRLKLLLNLSNNDRSLQKAVNMCRAAKKFSEEVLACFLQYFYMRKPTLCKLANEVCSHGTVYSTHLPEENKTEMDLVIHRLIVSVSEPDGSEGWNEKFESISALHRRLAVQHPFAFVRQLPLLLSLMKGKDRLTASAFKWTNQLALCNHVFDLFDLLRPHVFTANETGKNLISEFTDVFLDLIYAPCLHNDDVAAFVGKLSTFLTHYVFHNGEDAGRLLKKHEVTFRELLYDFPNFNQLTSLLAFVKAFDEKSSTQCSIVGSVPVPWTDSQLKTFRKRLSINHHEEDLLAALHELKDSSKRCVNLLEHYLDEISALALSVDEEIREEAHNLLLVYYRNNPKNSGSLIELYSRCLNSDNPGVLRTAAKHSPQGLLLSQDHVDRFLHQMYKVAVTSQPEISKNLKAVIKSFNYDYEYCDL